MTNQAARSKIAGEEIFPRLQALGVDYVFVNSGTDFPPIIEGLAKAADAGQPLPQAVVVPHEHAALGMGHGYYLMSGRAQAVMLHTNMGLANGAIGALNAACDHVPMLLMSGRTPATEQDRFGARRVPIGWGQEMRDQTALVREACKWDYELRFPEQTAPMLDRAYAIANSTPKGPVYLSLPREVLCEAISPTDSAPVPPSPPVAIAQCCLVPNDLRQISSVLVVVRTSQLQHCRGSCPVAHEHLESMLTRDFLIVIRTMLRPTRCMMDEAFRRCPLQLPDQSLVNRSPDAEEQGLLLPPTPSRTSIHAIVDQRSTRSVKTFIQNGCLRYNRDVLPPEVLSPDMTRTDLEPTAK